MNLVEMAVDLAQRAHAGQMRKYGISLPYIMHPAEVACKVARLPGVTEEEVAAAWLHDVVEDCDQRFIDWLNTCFPARVRELVMELTNPSKGSPLLRAERKKMDREHLAKCSVEARRIKLIDRIVNLRDIRQAEYKFKALYVRESWDLLNALGGTDDALEIELEEILCRLDDELITEQRG